MEECKFHVYKFEFVCDFCGLVSSLGIVGLGGRYSNVCDLCLVNELADYFTTSSTPADTNIQTTAPTSNDETTDSKETDSTIK